MLLTNLYQKVKNRIFHCKKNDQRRMVDDEEGEIYEV